MKVDLLLIPFGATYVEMRTAALAAEEAGFDGVWTWDHLQGGGNAGPAPVPECWTVLSAIAEATSRVAIGSLVLNVFNRHPGTLANMAATLQEVSEGRLLLGLGAGGSTKTPYAAEQQALGRAVPGDAERRAHLVDAIAVLRALWSGAGEFEGTHYQVSGATGFLQPAHPPPIIVGGFGMRMAALAGAHGDGFNVPAQVPSLPELVAQARRAHGEAARETPFEISAFTGMREAYLRPATPERTYLAERVDRLILLLEPPFDPADILDAGQLLHD